jgi:hypothetical protein
LFKISAGENGGIDVLKGQVRADRGWWAATMKLQELQGFRLQADGGKPYAMNRQVWMGLGELYEMIQKSAAAEAMQMDLSKEAGGLFSFVFDHGTFYTPKIGYCGRDFYRDDREKIRLRLEYDVFPKGSYVGMYIKTRDLDLSKYDKLEFLMRRLPDEGYPLSVRIEIKNKSGIMRAYAAKRPGQDWTRVTLPLNLRGPALVTEIALVFLHDRVGEDKRGVIELKDFELMVQPKPAEPPVKAS